MWTARLCWPPGTEALYVRSGAPGRTELKAPIAGNPSVPAVRVQGEVNFRVALSRPCALGPVMGIPVVATLCRTQSLESKLGFLRSQGAQGARRGQPIRAYLAGPGVSQHLGHPKPPIKVPRLESRVMSNQKYSSWVARCSLTPPSGRARTAERLSSICRYNRQI